MSTLLMLTNDFPYGNDTGEMYLRNEIFTLSSFYKEIIIFSCRATKKDNLYCNNLPINVVVYPLMKVKSQLINYCFGMIKYFFLKKNVELKEEKKELKLSQKIFLYYFLSKAKKRFKKIQNIIKSRSFDGDIHIYSYRLFDTAYIATKLKDILSDNNRVICFSRAHRYDLYEEKNRFNYLPMREYLYEKLDYIFPCSYDGEKYLKYKYPAKALKFRCFYLGSFRTKYDLIDNKCEGLHFVSCSTLLPVKRVDKIAEFVKILYDENYYVSWTHIGGSGKDINKISGKYKDLVDKGIINMVGSKTHDQIFELYSKNIFNLFLNFSESEGIPQAIMEAMSFGIPVLATNVGGNSEIVDSGKNGYLVNSNLDFDEIQKYIDEYINMAEENKKRLSKAAFDKWNNVFNTSTNAVKFAKFIGEL